MGVIRDFWLFKKSPLLNMEEDPSILEALYVVKNTIILTPCQF